MLVVPEENPLPVHFSGMAGAQSFDTFFNRTPFCSAAIDVIRIFEPIEAEAICISVSADFTKSFPPFLFTMASVGLRWNSDWRSFWIKAVNDLNKLRMIDRISVGATKNESIKLRTAFDEIKKKIGVQMSDVPTFIHGSVFSSWAGKAFGNTYGGKLYLETAERNGARKYGLKNFTSK